MTKQCTLNLQKEVIKKIMIIVLKMENFKNTVNQKQVDVIYKLILKNFANHISNHPAKLISLRIIWPFIINTIKV